MMCACILVLHKDQDLNSEAVSHNECLELRPSLYTKLKFGMSGR